MEIANDQLSKALGRANECMRRLIEAGLSFEDLQTPISYRGMRILMVEHWKELSKHIKFIEPFFHLVIGKNYKGEPVSTALQIDDELLFDTKNQTVNVYRRSLGMKARIYFNQFGLDDKSIMNLTDYDEVDFFCKKFLEKFLGISVQLYTRETIGDIVYAKVITTKPSRK